jgi:glycosyltransferase involved in cell wall biosynthesis
VLRNNLYYFVKPLLPRAVRLRVRHGFATRKRRRVADVWPIIPGSEKPPEGWPGWPDGKKFALVLTHDVEGPEGLAKVLKLMEVEKQFGFRSAFNLIPEGDYQVSAELRHAIQSQGFELGVHDLHHDGKLFLNRSEFNRKVPRINHYLKEWGASGFRSGFMLRNLDWIHKLNVRYDGSTFDTDPFEPQPQGQGTIFPFWVQQMPAPGQWEQQSHSTEGGYVELPYTLPQDSTLFLVLRERHPDLWFQKLDWVARHGGMALVNVHPDYLRFSGEPETSTTYPYEYYTRFLSYVREKYSGCVWNALPREVADYYHNSVLVKSPSQSPVARGHVFREKRAAVVLYSGFPSDPRPRRELESLLDRGMAVDLICLQEEASQPQKEHQGNLTVTRVPIQHQRSSKLRYFWDYTRFFLHALGILSTRGLRLRYDLVHVHNMPDFLVFTALIPRLRGARILLDLHDPMPELYQTIYRLSAGGLMVRMLKVLERWSIGFSDLVITPNEAFRRLFSSRSCPKAKVEIVMNTPDEHLFRPAERPVAPSEGWASRTRFRLMYHGLIAERHGLGTALNAVKKASSGIPGLALEIYGKPNAYLDEIVKMAEGLQLNGALQYKGKKRIDDIPSAILDCDLGIIPNCRTPFTELNFPTRIFEYLSLGKPVIVPRTRGILDYFSEQDILFFEPDDADDLAAKIRWAYDHPREVQLMIQRGMGVYLKHSWELERHRFYRLVEGLLVRD